MTPKAFKEELNAGSRRYHTLTNSPGGDYFAAAQIYNMLMDYPGNVTVKIDGLGRFGRPSSLCQTKVCIAASGHADDP